MVGAALSAFAVVLFAGSASAAPSALVGGALSVLGEDLVSVSCTQSGACLAVGSDLIGQTSRGPLAVAFGPGGPTAMRPPLPRPPAPGLVASFAAVSCPVVANQCVAVGDFTPQPGPGTPTSPGRALFVTTYLAAAWRSVPLPMPTGAPVASVSLSGLSCVSLTTCVAVGAYSEPRRANTRVRPIREGLILSEAGGRWSALTAPLPGGTTGRPDVVLSGVTCTAGTPCVAVGTYLSGGRRQLGEVLTRTSGSWSAASAPMPAGGDGVDELNAVSCPTAGLCEAVGAFDVTGAPWGLVLTRAGGRWVAAAGPDPLNSNGIYGVACTGPAACVAAGTILGRSLSEEPLLFTGPANHLGSFVAPLPSGDPSEPGPGLGATLNAVSCPPSGQCLAVGTYVSASNRQSGLALALAIAARPPPTVPAPAVAAPEATAAPPTTVAPRTT